MPETLTDTLARIRDLEDVLACTAQDDPETDATIKELHQLRAHAQALRVTA